jgi:DNA repair protein RadC
MPVKKTASADAPDYREHRERLRGKFNVSGPTALYNYEMLELLLTYVIPRKDVKSIAKTLLKKFGTIKAVMDADPAELVKIHGVGPKTPILFKLAKEIGSLYLKEKAKEKPQISCTTELLNFCKMALGGLSDERFCVIHLNAQNRVIEMETIQEGIVNQAVVYPRKVLENALKRKASAVILVHNHPSGHVKPSDADIKLTKTIQETARMLDIIVHDHIIIGGNSFFSFREEGILF